MIAAQLAQKSTSFPTFKIIVGGNPLDRSIGVNSIRVTKTVNAIPSAEIALYDGSVSDKNFLLSSGDQLIPGTSLEIQSGYHRKDDSIFKGIIIRQSIKSRPGNSSFLVVELRDIAVKMTVGRKSRAFKENDTDENVLNKILKEYPDLTPKVESFKINHRNMTQYHVSDWDFIVQRAEANGKLVLVDDSEIQIAAPDLNQKPKLTATYGIDMYDLEAEIDSRSQYAQVTSYAWNQKGQSIKEKSGRDPGYDPGNQTTNELSKVIGLNSFALRHPGISNDLELQEWSSAQLLKTKLAKIRGRMKIQGYSDIKPGQMIQLQGCGDRFNGVVYASGISHHFSSKSNWYTEVEFGLSQAWFAQRFSDINDEPASGLIPGIRGLHIGKVTKIHEDPDKEFRVRVNNPLIEANGKGIWARIITPECGVGAQDGQSRGLFLRPEVGDEVVLGFLNEDPRHPVVLGSLYSSAQPAPLKATEQNNEKGFISRNQLKLLINDDEKSILLETPGGTRIEINEKKESITIEQKDQNKMLFDKKGITILTKGDLKVEAEGKITFTSKGDLVQDSGSTWKTSATNACELGSKKAQTKVLGSKVFIN